VNTIIQKKLEGALNHISIVKELNFHDDIRPTINDMGLIEKRLIVAYEQILAMNHHKQKKLRRYHE